MSAEKGVQQFYNRYFVEGMTKEQPRSYSVKVRVPRSVTCPDLNHLSPSDYTLVVMQAAATATLNEYPVHYPDVLFLSHQAKYLDQNQVLLDLRCRLKTPRQGGLSVLNIEVADQSKFEGRLMGGIISKMPQPLVEHHDPRGEAISPDQIAEVLSIYSAERQSDIMAIGYDEENHIFEAISYFPPYTEMPIMDHVSARQMIEALIKASLCGAAHMAFLGELPITYEEFLSNRLNFRTREHNLRYRKLLAPGTQSLIRFNITISGNNATVVFTHRLQASKEEESFATGQMTFYLPERG